MVGSCGDTAACGGLPAGPSDPERPLPPRLPVRGIISGGEKGSLSRKVERSVGVADRCVSEFADVSKSSLVVAC